MGPRGFSLIEHQLGFEEPAARRERKHSSSVDVTADSLFAILQTLSPSVGVAFRIALHPGESHSSI
jgi:hypothetical protein